MNEKPTPHVNRFEGMDRADVIGHWTDGPDAFVICKAKDLKLGVQTFGPPAVSASTDDAMRPVLMAHGYTIKDGQSDLKPYVYAAARELIARFGAQASSEAPRDLSTAPRDGTIIRLLVEFDDHALEDDDKPMWTIGGNTFDNTGEDLWQFAGWCWTHDRFTEGVGKPIGWLPLVDAAQQIKTTPPFDIRTD